MYTVIGSPNARTLRVTWMLEELGESYRIDPVKPASAQAFAHHPMGKVPALITPQGTVFDSTAILTHLTDAHSRFTHAPGSHARARQDAATCLLMTEIDAALWLKAKHRFALPVEHRLEGVGPVASFEYSRALAALGSMFEGAPYLAGDTPTVPDFILAHCLSWAVAAKMPDLPQELAQYHATMTARPALAAAKAKGDSALA